MKAAVVRAAGHSPVHDTFADPVPADGQDLIQVNASALSQLARIRASGRHYSSEGLYPLVAGVDGVGLRADGQRVYFAFPDAPYGAMAEQIAVPAARCVPLPDALDDVTAAALANPGMSSWMALALRADFKPGETVLIHGATGSSGQLAVQIARHFGAGKIIATGRNPVTLSRLRELGADEIIPLTTSADEMQHAFGSAFAAGVDIVLDYLWGETARMIMAATARITDPARPMRFVQIGSMTGNEVTIPAAFLRSRANLFMGSGLGSVAPDAMMHAIGALLSAAPEAGFVIDTDTAPLSDVAEAWERDTGNRRLVFTI